MRTNLFIIALCVFSIVGRSFATEQNGLEFIASCSRDEDGVTRDSKAQSEGIYRYTFTIIVKNVGSTPVVVLKGETGQPGYGQVAGQFILYVTYALSRTALGDLNIPAESELCPVKLQSGEAVEFHAAVRADEKIKETDWTARYEIAPDVATRFGTWGGKIETKTLNSHQLDALRYQRLKKN